MTNDKVQTTLTTVNNEILSFQEYFVEKKADPKLKKIDYVGSDSANITSEVSSVLKKADQIIIGPSNPFLSIGPILSINKIRKLIVSHNNVVVVSPFINNKALKGPSDKNFKDFGFQPNIEGLKVFYQDIANQFIVHENENEEENVFSKNILFSEESVAVNLAKEIVQHV